MLVLTRKSSERIMIPVGDDLITITLCEIRREKCRIGIEAPDHIQILREEVYKQNQQQSESAPVADTAE